MAVKTRTIQPVIVAASTALENVSKDTTKISFNEHAKDHCMSNFREQFTNLIAMNFVNCMYELSRSQYAGTRCARQSKLPLIEAL